MATDSKRQLSDLQIRCANSVAFWICRGGIDFEKEGSDKGYERGVSFQFIIAQVLFKLCCFMRLLTVNLIEEVYTEISGGVFRF